MPPPKCGPAKSTTGKINVISVRAYEFEFAVVGKTDTTSDKCASTKNTCAPKAPPPKPAECPAKKSGSAPDQCATIKKAGCTKQFHTQCRCYYSKSPDKPTCGAKDKKPGKFLAKEPRHSRFLNVSHLLVFVQD